MLKREIGPENDLIVFDQIQEVPRALTSLKYFAEECPSFHIAAHSGGIPSIGHYYSLELPNIFTRLHQHFRRLFDDVSLPTDPNTLTPSSSHAFVPNQTPQ